jgi:SAM-dependent methyltransferase
MPDATFDRMYPPRVRDLSRRFWTPVGVARRAAQLFRQAGTRNVLDVGSGVGKFVLVAAIEAPEVCFTGIEQRAHLVEIARQTSALLKLPNVHFYPGDAGRMPWHGYDGLYFFNPFAENLFEDGDEIDKTVVCSKERFFENVISSERGLWAAPMGTTVVTYHGMSGRMPACYELRWSERAGSDWLRLWRKERPDRHGFFLEYGDEVVLHQPDGSLA